MTLRILTVNDDGIEAQGIRELSKSLSDIAEIYMFAPSTQKSAAGHGISISNPLKVTKKDVPFTKEAYAVEGTPADCTKIGLHILAQKGIEIDLVCSGINHGGNLGTDTLYSGTVSAAIEGNLCGKPAIAVSVNDHNPIDFTYACELALKTAKKLGEKIKNEKEGKAAFEMKRTTLSINVPNLTYEEIKGVRYAELGPREYDEWFTPVEIEDIQEEMTAYKYTGNPVVYDNLPENNDVMLIQQGYATITPLQYNLTDKELLKSLDIL